MSNIISIHQPNYLPWMGYFHKMTYCDVFVFLDDVQYTPKTYINRAQIIQNGELVRLSIPATVPKWDSTITEVSIGLETFGAKHLASLRHAYGKCRNFDIVMDVLSPHYDTECCSLAEFNMGLITDIAAFIGLKPQFIKLSELSLTSAKNDLLIDIATSCGGGEFVSGIGARTYICGNELLYQDASISLSYQNFVHPEYRQRKEPFIKGASILDLLFNHGTDALDILTSQIEPSFIHWKENLPRDK